MDPITIALGLAQFAPTLLKFFGAGQGSVKAAQKVVDIASTVTGAKTPQEALDMMAKNSELASAFNLAVLKQDGDLTIAYLTDVQSARNRDIELNKSGNKNNRANYMFALAVLLIAGLVWIVWQDQSINEYAKGIFTLVLGRFLGYLDNIYNFEFGTTRSSQVKDDTISNLSK